MKKFNNLAVIAPSELLDSGIHIDRYSDRVADIFYGFDVERLYLTHGYTGDPEVDVSANDSIERMSKRLQEAYKIPAGIILKNTSTSADFQASFSEGIARHPEFFEEVTARKRELGLITDELQMALGSEALSALKIKSVGFEVQVPLFGGNRSTVDSIQSPIDSSEYRTSDRPITPVAASAGDD